MSQVLVLSMSYGYVGPLHTGAFCNSNTNGCYQRVLNDESTYANQILSLITFAIEVLQNTLQNSSNFNPIALNYLHILSHSVTVIDGE